MNLYKYLFICLFIYLLMNLYFYLFIFLFVCLFMYLFISLLLRADVLNKVSNLLIWFCSFYSLVLYLNKIILSKLILYCLDILNSILLKPFSFRFIC